MRQLSCPWHYAYLVSKSRPTRLNTISECLKHSAICVSFCISHSWTKSEDLGSNLNNREQYQSNYLAQITHRLEHPSFIFIAIGHNNLGPCLCYTCCLVIVCFQ